MYTWSLVSLQGVRLTLSCQITISDNRLSCQMGKTVILGIAIVLGVFLVKVVGYHTVLLSKLLHNHVGWTDSLVR